MLRKKYVVAIDAPREKVWEVLWSDENYGKWTSVFYEGSHAESDWQENSRIRFLSPDGDGMYSTILKKDEPRFISFRHDGEVKGGKDLPNDEKSSQWAGATENYTLTEDNGRTELVVEIDLVESHEAYFDEKFPKGLQLVKGMAEENVQMSK